MDFDIDLPPANYDYLFKLVVVGDANVGKSSFLARLVDNNVSLLYIPTIGVDFQILNVYHAFQKIKLQMWDTAGQERFRQITTSYYRGSMAPIFVFDLTNRESFKHMEIWFDRYKNESWKREFKSLLLGNKADLVLERKVTFEEAKEFAQNRGMDYVEVSAINNNAEECKGVMKILIDRLLDGYPNMEDEVTKLKKDEFKYRLNCF